MFLYDSTFAGGSFAHVLPGAEFILAPLPLVLACSLTLWARSELAYAWGWPH